MNRGKNTEANRDSVLAHLRAGKSTYETAKLLGVSEGGIGYWVKRDTAFAAQYRDALAQSRKLRLAWRRAQAPPKPACKIADCDKPKTCRDMCKTHYHQWLVTGAKYTAPPIPKKLGQASGLQCEVPSCDKPMRCKGLCNSHYKQSLGSITCPKCNGTKKATAAVCAPCFNQRRLERPLHKLCKVCRRSLTLDKFVWREREGGSSPREACRECLNARARLVSAERRQADPKGFRLRKNELRRAQRENLREQGMEWLLYALRYSCRRIGLDPLFVLDRFMANGNKCEACGDPCSIEPGKRVQVDHCHETGRFRGFLCGRCNMIAGQAQDDIERLKMVAQYLAGRPSDKLENPA